jgi:hypothetical protein
MQKIIKIHPCLLKLSRKQESVTDGQTATIKTWIDWKFFLHVACNYHYLEWVLTW